MKKLVILGGGAAGFMIAAKIKHKGIPDLQVFLVDTKDFFEYTPALCSVLYEENIEKFNRHFDKVTFDYKAVSRTLGFQFIQGTVQDLKDNQVYIEQEEMVVLDYDYIVICTGSGYAEPWKTSEKINREERRHYLSTQRQAYLDAQEILCIGGGPVGVELLAEIAYRSPHKSLTLVHSADTVLANTPLKHEAQRILKMQKIQMIMNEKAEKRSEGIYATSDGEIKTDLVYNCVGIQPNSDFLKKTHSDWLNEKGNVKVQGTLRVQDNVFAVGDVNDVDEPKMYYTAHMQAIHFVNNLSRLLKGQELKVYGGARPAMFVSMGPDWGVGHIAALRFVGSCDRGSRTAAWIKYMIEKFCTQQGNRWEMWMNEGLYLMS